MVNRPARHVRFQHGNCSLIQSFHLATSIFAWQWQDLWLQSQNMLGNWTMQIITPIIPCFTSVCNIYTAKTCSHIAYVHHICQQKFYLPFLKRHPTPSVRNQVSEISALMRHRRLSAVEHLRPKRTSTAGKGYSFCEKIVPSIEIRRFFYV